MPNNGTIGASDDYPVDYDWRTYVTNNCPTATANGCMTVDPYKVTVIVEWEGAGTAADGVQRVTTQSLFHSPSGCVSSQTHPFAAPCQPFFYGQAIAPVGVAIQSGWGRKLYGSHGYLPSEPAMGAILVAVGRGAQPGAALGEPSALDVAPTVLRLLGLEVPDNMQGRPIANLLPAPSAAAAPAAEKR